MLEQIIENNSPQTLEQFTMLQQQIAVQNLVNDLTANRRLGNKRSKKVEQILLGHNKITALTDKFKA